MTQPKNMEIELNPLSYKLQAKNNDSDVRLCEKYSKWLPSKQKAILFASQGIVTVLLFATIFGIVGKKAFPVSQVFSILTLALLAHVGGQIAKIVRLPPLVGMLVVGFLYRNLPFIKIYELITVQWASSFRGSALVIILLKAGLGLDAEKLRMLSRTVFQLAFAPCIIETIAAGISAHFLLNLPWSWAIMLGFVVAAVSPAVIVPGLLNLQNRNLGTDKGIPTLVIAAASVDDILAITGFTVMLTFSLAKDNLILAVLKGICEPVGGFIFGLGYGKLLWYLPNSRSSSFQIIYYHVLLLCLGGLSVMFLSKELEVGGAGPMGCLVLAFIAAYSWKKDQTSFNYVEKIITLFWRILEPFLFSLIGAEVSVDNLQSNLDNTCLALFIGLAFRILTASLVSFGGGFNIKEKIFIAFAWLPKATVQAAIGSQALDFVVSTNGSLDMREYGQKILNAAVLSIIMTAPIGAALIAVLGPKLLTQGTQSKKEINPDEDERSVNICEGVNMVESDI